MSQRPEQRNPGTTALDVRADRAASSDVGLFGASLGSGADPYALYAQLRAETPIHRTPHGLWVLTRYADVVARLSGLIKAYAGGKTEPTPESWPGL